MGAIFMLVLSMVATSVLGGYNGYLGFPQTIGAPYVDGFQPHPVFPFNIPRIPPAIPVVKSFLPANLPNHYYTPPGNTYSGFSYHTQFQNGGSSRVTFVTGPQSRELMQQSLRQFRTLTGGPDAIETLALPANTVTNSTSPEVAGVEVNSGNDVAPLSTPAPSFGSTASPVTVTPITQTGPVASVYRVQVFPSLAHNFVQAPFPYHPFVSTFYHTVPVVRTNPNMAPMQENADYGQESMINEIGAVPILKAGKESVAASSSTTAVPVSSAPPSSTITPETTSEISITTPGKNPLAEELFSAPEAELARQSEAVPEKTTEERSSVEQVSTEAATLTNDIAVDSSTDASEEVASEKVDSVDDAPTTVATEQGSTNVPEENSTPLTTESSSSDQ